MNRYGNTKTTKTADGVEYLVTTRYPDIPRHVNDYYVMTSVGDRYDTLAQQFYSDSSLWRIIACANNSQQASLVVEPGIQLRVPGNVDTVIDNYRNANK